MRTIVSQMKKLTTMRDDELMREAKELGAPLELIRQIAKTGKLPVPNFSAGGIATPADAALVRKLGAEAVFVGSGIFKSSDPETRAKAVVKATTHFEDPKIVLEAHEELGETMKRRRPPDGRKGHAVDARLVAGSEWPGRVRGELRK
jgi:pyridoxal 5'-phosphate synthase pdxS subunit